MYTSYVRKSKCGIDVINCVCLGHLNTAALSLLFSLCHVEIDQLNVLIEFRLCSKFPIPHNKWGGGRWLERWTGGG